MRKSIGMRFSIRFKIGNRWGAASRYTLKEFCASIVDRYSLTEIEACNIVTLHVKEVFSNNEMQVTRVS